MQPADIKSHVPLCLSLVCLSLLQHTKPAGSVHVDRQIPNRHLTRTIAEQGICYPYLLQTHRDLRDGNDTRGATVGGFTSSRYLAPAEGKNAPKVWRGDIDAPMWNPSKPGETTTQRAAAQIMAEKQQSGRNHISPSRQHPTPPSDFQRTQQQQQAPAPVVPRHLQSSYSSFAPPARTQYRPTAAADTGGVPSLDLAPFGQQQQSHANSPPAVRPTTPVLHLDLQMARTLKPQYLQDIGSCVWTNGVDPSVKYRHPLLSSHRVGWGIQNKTLEFFGRSTHAARDLSNKTLYGW